MPEKINLQSSGSEGDPVAATCEYVINIHAAEEVGKLFASSVAFVPWLLDGILLCWNRFIIP